MSNLFRHALRVSFCAAIALAALVLAPQASADRVVTKDGRIVTPAKARERDGVLRLEFVSGGVVEIKDKSLIRSIEVEGDMSDYVPANDDEKEKLAQGYVRYRGRWWSKAAYEAELAKAFADSKKRIEEIKARSTWGTGWEKETAHFRFVTNTGPELLEYYAELLETYYNLMDNRIGIKPTPSLMRTKMVVNIYKSYEDFHANAAAPDLSPGVLGYFWAYDKTLNFYHDYQEPEQSTWVALHECTHLLTYLIDDQYEPQIWLNEAVADYFGSSKVYRDKKGKLVIEPGLPQLDRVLTVQQAIGVTESGQAATGGARRQKNGRGYTKLEELFLIDRGAFDGFQYAHAWSFVYFLNTWEDGKHQKNFNRFFKEIYTRAKGIPSEPMGRGFGIKPVDIRAHLLKRIGEKDVDKLEKAWLAYIKAMPVEGPTARMKRGTQKLREGEFDEALADLNEAIEQGCKDPRAFVARAKALAFKDQDDKAMADLQKALEIDPLDADVYYDLSALKLGLLNTRVGRGEGGGPRLEGGGKLSDQEAKAWAGLAMELDPENDYYRQWYERFE